MNRNRPRRATGRVPAATLHEDDGIDPRIAFSRVTPGDRRTNVRSLQLCREAERALRFSLLPGMGADA
ncbi:MAG: hypothetical protein IPM64_11675 [Phycisphaerales bacterium]|nr:hypothetical protein [Phycisphaerales bacterium]